MEAVEVLMNEHRLIERVIDALVAFAAETSRKSGDEKAELGQFVTFIRELADEVHHGKEEEVLFAAMVEAGFPRGTGPVGVMLSEHAEGRRLVSVLRGLATQAAPWSPAERQLLVEAANGYGALLRNHIHKEDAILYPMPSSGSTPPRRRASTRSAPSSTAARPRASRRCTPSASGSSRPTPPTRSRGRGPRPSRAAADPGDTDPP